MLRRRTLLHRLLWVLLSGVAICGRGESESVVLVVRIDSKVIDLDPLAVRKLFLGLPVLVNGAPLHPIRNRSDARLELIFLQQIVAMSQEGYERQILRGINTEGRIRPAESSNRERILAMLRSDPYAVTFVWSRDVAHEPDARVIRVLWND